MYKVELSNSDQNDMEGKKSSGMVKFPIALYVLFGVVVCI